jgi:hypothetical protein
MSTRTIVVLLVAVLAVLYAAWFVTTHDRVSAQQWIGPTGEARLKPFLAAQRLAERMGLETNELRSLPALEELPSAAVLIVPAPRQELHSAKIAELLRWVERGGHLIAEAEYVGVPDPLFDRLGVKRVRVEAAASSLFVMTPDGSKLRAYFGDSMHLAAPQPQRVRLRAGEHLVSFARGRGMVTLATSLRFARNPGLDDEYARMSKRPARSIGGLDHAALFWAVLSLTPERELHVYFRPERLSLWEFLIRNAAPVLIAGGLLLALWLWSIGPRFGPVAPDTPPGRRRLLDHLRASGRYYWGRGMRSRLVVAARDAALRRIARAQPDFPVSPSEERVARLATLAGISKEEATRFMSAAGAMRGLDFIRIVQHAQRIHAALEKGIRR